MTPSPARLPSSGHGVTYKILDRNTCPSDLPTAHVSRLHNVIRPASNVLSIPRFLTYHQQRFPSSSCSCHITRCPPSISSATSLSLAVRACSQRRPSQLALAERGWLGPRTSYTTRPSPLPTPLLFKPVFVYTALPMTTPSLLRLSCLPSPKCLPLRTAPSSWMSSHSSHTLVTPMMMPTTMPSPTFLQRSPWLQALCAQSIIFATAIPSHALSLLKSRSTYATQLASPISSKCFFIKSSQCSFLMKTL